MLIPQNPLVSICCVTYNHIHFINECLEGFLMQETDFDYEIIVHDDASTDGTRETLLRYADKYPNKFKLILQNENQWSQGVRGIFARFTFPVANGKYIALCEGDDYWTDPLKLQKQVDFLEANQNIGLVFTNAKTLNAQDNSFGCLFPSLEKDQSLLSLRKFLLINKVLPTATFVFRQSFVNQDLIDNVTKKNFFGDGLLILSIFSGGKNIEFLNESTAVYRVNNPNSLTFNTITIFQIKNWIMVLRSSRKYFDKREDRQALNTAIAFQYFRLAEFLYKRYKLRAFLTIFIGLFYAPHMTKIEFKDSMYWIKLKLKSQ